MIVDILENADRYASLNKRFVAAFDFLRREDIPHLAEGRHDIEGDALYAMVARGRGRKRETVPLETHHKYIDIQYVISGLDEMGWKPARECELETGHEDSRNDVKFFKDVPEMYIPLGPGMFAVCFPEDAHQPMVGEGHIHKIVVKVPV